MRLCEVEERLTFGGNAQRPDVYAWRDYGVVSILTTHFRPDQWASNAYLAVTGDFDGEILSKEGTPLRWKLMCGQIVSDTVQAIGRVRCRKVVDKDGNCDPTDVYLLLPGAERGEDILAGIKSELPGVQVVQWAYDGKATKARPKASKIEEAFAICLKNLPKGTTTAKELLRGAFQGCSSSLATRRDIST